jgi:hypothetical protein
LCLYSKHFYEHSSTIHYPIFQPLGRQVQGKTDHPILLHNTTDENTSESTDKYLESLLLETINVSQDNPKKKIFFIKADDKLIYDLVSTI